MQNRKLLIWIIALAAVAFILAVIFSTATDDQFGGPGSVHTTASSTTYTVTTASSLRVLATSTKRVAASIQPLNCASNGYVTLNGNNDAVATANNGFAAFASSTFAFGDRADLPMLQNSIQAIANNGTCTVLVTEWRN